MTEMPTVLLIAEESSATHDAVAAIRALPACVTRTAMPGATAPLTGEQAPAVVVYWAHGLPQAVEALAATTSAPIVVVATRPTLRGARLALRLGAADYLGARDGSAAIAAAVEQALLRRPAASRSDDVVSLVAHELRTPLMAITGYLDLMQRMLERGSQDRLREFIARSLRSADELSRVSDLLLQTMQIEAGRFLPALRPVAIAPIVADAIEACHPLATTHQLSHSVMLDLAVCADPQALRVVLDNLIGNAIKYSPDGGNVTVSATRAGEDAIEIAVSDEGIGIAPDRMAALFGRFARVHDRERWPAIRGTGLGLYVCHLLVAAQGGTIRAASAPGAGSTFRVTLPAAVPARLAMSAVS
jgi:signal transduction histidine kinase